MIVKNEAPVIKRCLDSVRPIVDHWVIVDTGSTDGTQDIIRTAMVDIPGSLVERPWVNFAFNRTEALKLAKPHASYSLIIDADDELIIPNDFVFPKLSASAYTLTIMDGQSQYSRIQIVDNKKDWIYLGVIHEFLVSSENSDAPMIPLAMFRGHDGARRRDKSTALKDIVVLEKALAVEKTPFMIARYTFYLACYYRDNNKVEGALDLFLKRSKLGHGDEEIYVSLINAAYIMEELNRPEVEILELYNSAIRLIPIRAEAQHGASRYCRHRNNFSVGYQYAELGVSLDIPAEGADLKPWIYVYGLRDEFSIHAYNIGQYRACLSACFDILNRPDVPADVLSRTTSLARLALSKMVDPLWGTLQSATSSEYIAAWRS